MGRLARRRGHGEFQEHPRAGQVAGRVDQRTVLLALVQHTAEHAHVAPQREPGSGAVARLTVLPCTQR
ncbi:hypothetical protein G6F58_013828 [Rhizopus delemar]|nr:hypothetical protein G6F58_013828 [Rhizopus delemar]